MNLELNYDGWWLILPFLGGLTYSITLYKRNFNSGRIENYVVLLMALFRFVSVSLLIFFLLEPLITTSQEIIEKPVVIWAQDCSESVAFDQDSLSMQTYVRTAQEQINALRENYEVITLGFGENLEDSLKWDFDKKQTDIGGVFKEINSRFYGRNLGAVVLASDGIFNKGADPLYSAARLKNAPVFTVAMGDTSVRKDLLINRLSHNQLAYFGNDFPLEVIVQGVQLTEDSCRVSVYHSEKLVASKLIKLKDKQLVACNFELPANKVGKLKYEVKLSELKNEVTYINNHKSFQIEILDAKQKILMLTVAPHPDIAAVRQAIEENINYQIEVTDADNFKDDLQKYSLVILNQIPSVGIKRDFYSECSLVGVPVLFMMGTKSNIGAFNELKTGVTLEKSTGFVDATAYVNNKFAAFNLPETFSDLASRYPPLMVPFAANYKTSNLKDLLHQKIGLTATSYPLLSFGEKNGVKFGVLMGEGIWRWKLFEYQQYNTKSTFNFLIEKTIQFLVAKENKKYFRVSGRDVFLENEHVFFDAEIYNASYELINNQEITLEIFNAAGQAYPLKSFSRSGKAYRLDAGILPVGDYNYVSVAVINGKTTEERGSFSVQEIQEEYTKIQAMHGLMNQLAQQSDGAYFHWTNFDNLSAALMSKNEIVDVVYYRKDVDDLLNKKWFFIIFIALFGAEWFTRKRNGTY